jgi:hypothetical protein
LIRQHEGSAAPSAAGRPTSVCHCRPPTPYETGMASFRTPFDTAIQSVTQSGAPFEIARAKFAGIEYLHYVNAPTTLTELLAAGRGHGDKEFIVYQQERWSFAEFYDQADRLAAQLTDAFKIKPGERVAIAMRNYPEWLSAFVAITSIGAVVVPINSWGQAAELYQNLSPLSALVRLRRTCLLAVIIFPKSSIVQHPMATDQTCRLSTAKRRP